MSETFIYPQANLIAGVDEVGRGPLVGAVVTAAVILDPNRPIVGLADSKNSARSAACHCMTKSLKRHYHGVLVVLNRKKLISLIFCTQPCWRCKELYRGCILYPIMY